MTGCRAAVSRALGVLALVAALAFAAPAVALAATAEAGSSDGSTADANASAGSSDTSIGTLSDRYQSLEALENATDDTDNVVTATRIGVLTGSNRAMDGSTVSFSGEVVGDIMNGGDGHKWLNVQGSDGSCIGVWVDDDMAARIDNVGDYATTGAKVQVRGLYSIDCDEHQGELDVHAVDIRVLDNGGKVTHLTKERDIYIGLVLCGLGFLLIIVFFGVRMYFDRRDDHLERLRNMGISPDDDIARRKRRWPWSKRGTEDD